MNANRGYALFLAVIVVVGLALALLTVARVQADLAPQAHRALNSARAASEAESVYARVGYLILTEAIGPASVELIARRDEAAQLMLDGRFYDARGDAIVAVQDELGLVNLNSFDEGAVAGALAEVGVSPRQTTRLAATLADYVDEDDLVRAGGAEARSYSEGNSYLNRTLSHRWDVLNVIGWRQALNIDQREAFWALTTASARQGGININTAPAGVLRAVLGDERVSQAILVRRTQRALRDIEEVQALTANSQSAAGAGFAISPGNAFRIVVAVSEGQRRYAFERRIEIGEAVADAPIRWRDERREQGGANLVEQGELPTLPGPWRDAAL
jgi:hypothetical protein